MSNKEIGLLVVAFAVVALLGAGAYALTSTPVQPTIIQVQAPQEVSAAATSPGTGGGVTTASALARECIIDLYGAAGTVPRAGVGQVSVDDTISACVKARGGQIVTGGQCDPDSSDGCSNTFSGAGQDPDSAFAALDLTLTDPDTGESWDALVFSDGTSAGGPEVCSGVTQTRRPVEIIAGACGRLTGVERCECATFEAKGCGMEVTRCAVGGGGGGGQCQTNCTPEVDICGDPDCPSGEQCLRQLCPSTGVCDAGLCRI